MGQISLSKRVSCPTLIMNHQPHKELAFSRGGNFSKISPRGGKRWLQWTWTHKQISLIIIQMLRIAIYEDPQPLVSTTSERRSQRSRNSAKTAIVRAPLISETHLRSVSASRTVLFLALAETAPNKWETRWSSHCSWSHLSVQNSFTPFPTSVLITTEKKAVTEEWTCMGKVARGLSGSLWSYMFTWTCHVPGSTNVPFAFF
jgi:hypothetical protein